MASTSKTVHAIVIHGVGEQEAGYSTFGMKKLSTALQRQGKNLFAQEVLWSPTLDGYEQEMLAQVRAKGSSNRPMQKLVVGTLADALAYPNVRDEIMDLVDRSFLRLRADSCYIFAHSLGVLIATDWLRSRDKVRVDKLVSFGCNLQLFQLGSRTAWPCPPQVGRPGSWVNCFDDQDGLGWPLSGWQKHVKDVEVEVGWTGLAHIRYFTDGDFWSETIPKLL